MRRIIKKVRVVPRNCQFCQTDTEPDYKETSTLQKYMSERGKILASSQTGVCSKHQRMLSNAIKRARIVALLPFVVRA